MDEQLLRQVNYKNLTKIRKSATVGGSYHCSYFISSFFYEETSCRYNGLLNASKRLSRYGHVIGR